MRVLSQSAQTDELIRDERARQLASSGKDNAVVERPLPNKATIENSIIPKA